MSRAFTGKARQPERSGDRRRQTTRIVVRRAMLRGRSIVNITEDVVKYAAEQAISEEEALKKGMQEMSKEYVEKGTEVYAKA